MKNRETWIGLGVATLAFGLGGCAHQQVSKTEDTGPATAIAQKDRAQAPAPPQSQDNADLEAIVRGTTIHFDFNADNLTQESRNRLQKVSEVMRKHPELKVKIAGNCDERGTEEYNIALGQRRADVAKTYLANLGVSSTNIETVSYGKERPVATGHNEDAWVQNRRDEFDAN